MAFGQAFSSSSQRKKLFKNSSPIQYNIDGNRVEDTKDIPINSTPTPKIDFIETPEYQSNGKVNPKYKSGKGSNVLAGIRSTIPMQTGDPFRDSGLLIGGALGGLFGKNTAGKEQYEQDRKYVDEENKKKIIMTEASQRLDAQAALIAQRAVASKIAEERNARAAITAEITDRKKLAEQLETNINKTSGEERRKYQVDHARLFNLPAPEEVDDDYMVGWKSVNLGGDLNYQQDSNGRIREAEFNGQSISKLGIEDQWRIAGLQNKLDPANIVDEQKIKDAFSTADSVLAPKKGEFKTNKGQFNAIQYNAQRMQIVNKILATQKGNPDLETTKIQVNIDGVPTEIDVPLIGRKTTPPPTEENKVYNAQPQSVTDFVSKLNAEEVKSNMALATATMKQNPKESQAYKDGEALKKALEIRVGQLSGATTPAATTLIPQEVPLTAEGGKTYKGIAVTGFKATEEQVKKGVVIVRKKGKDYQLVYDRQFNVWRRVE